MKTQPTKLKILAVGGVYTSNTVNKVTRSITMQVTEVATDNPFGHNKESQNPFDVLVYNHNIENFNITSALVGEIAHCELVISHYAGNGGPSVPKFIVNDLTFRI